MKTRNVSIIIACAVFLLTAAFILLHLNSDEVNAGNAVMLEYRGKQVTVPLEKLEAGEFSGILVNGKGRKTENIYTGVELRVLLETEGFDLSEVQYAKVTAQDQYSTEVLVEEIIEPGKIYIAVKKDGESLPGLKSGTECAQLIVFGDPDSRRCVRCLEAVALCGSDG